MARFIIGLISGFLLCYFLGFKGSSGDIQAFFSPQGKKNVQVIAHDIGAATKDLERAARSSWASIGNSCGKTGYVEIDQFREGDDLVFIGECKDQKGWF